MDLAKDQERLIIYCSLEVILKHYCLKRKNKMTVDLNPYLKIQRKLNIIKLVFSAEQLY